MPRIILMIIISIFVITAQAQALDELRRLGRDTAQAIESTITDIYEQALEIVDRAIADYTSTEYSETVEVPGAPTTDLFIFTNNLLNSMFNDTESTIETTNVVTGIMECKFAFSITHNTANVDVVSDLTITITEGTVTFHFVNPSRRLGDITAAAVQTFRASGSESRANTVSDAVVLDLTKNKEVLEAWKKFVLSYKETTNNHLWK